MENKKYSWIFLFLLLIWLFYSQYFFRWQASAVKKAMRFLPLSVEQKNMEVDGYLYNVAQSLRQAIPEEATVVIKNISRHPRYAPDWVKSEYETSRLAYYYLFPRKILLADAQFNQIQDYRIIYRLDKRGTYIKLYLPGEKEDGAF